MKPFNTSAQAVSTQVLTVGLGDQREVFHASNKARWAGFGLGFVAFAYGVVSIATNLEPRPGYVFGLVGGGLASACGLAIIRKFFRLRHKVAILKKVR